MFYLISQLLLLLVIASLLSGAIGWICRRFFTDKAHADQIRNHQRAGRRQVAEIDDLRRELTDRNAEVADLNSHLHQNREAIDRAETEKVGLYDDLDQMRGLENDYQKVTADLDRIDQERANAEEALKQALKAEAKKEVDLQQALQSDSANKEQLNAAATAVANLEEVIASLNSDISKKSAAADKATQHQATLAAKIDELDQKLAASEQLNVQKVNGLEKSLRAEKDSLASARQAIASGEEKIKGLESLLAERAGERDKLEQLASNQKRDIAALQQQINKLQEDAAEVKSSNEKAVASLEHALDKQAALTASADKHVENESRLNAKLQQDLDKLHSDLKDSTAAADNRTAKAADQLEQQKRATVEANSLAAALDNKLRDLQQEQTSLKQQDANTLAALNNSEKEVANRDEKIANAEKAIASLEAELDKRAAEANANEQRMTRELSGKDTEIKGKDKELQDAINLTLQLKEKIAEHQLTDAELRAMIAELQQLLSDERRLAGQSLLSRIKELEAMLEAERRKADELREIPEVTNLTWRSVIRTSAANSAVVDSKKTGTDKK